MIYPEHVAAMKKLPKCGKPIKGVYPKCNRPKGHCESGGCSWQPLNIDWWGVEEMVKAKNVRKRRRAEKKTEKKVKMKLIRKGKPKDQAIWKATCPDCDSVWEAMKKELTVTDTQRDGEFAHAKCGECGGGMIFYPKRPVEYEEQMGR